MAATGTTNRRWIRAGKPYNTERHKKETSVVALLPMTSVHVILTISSLLSLYVELVIDSSRGREEVFGGVDP